MIHPVVAKAIITMHATKLKNQSSERSKRVKELKDPVNKSTKTYN